MLLTETALRCGHEYEVTSAQAELEKGVNVSKDSIEKIQRLFSKIKKREDDPEIMWVSRGNTFVFKLDEAPGLVFKVPSYQGIDTMSLRFDKMVKAKRVCLVHNLALLIIPHAKKVVAKLGGRDQVIIAEEELNFNQDQKKQGEFYHEYSAHLNETVRQLTKFIVETGFDDVTPRNIPLLDEEEGYLGDRRVGLIDLEDMGSVRGGLEGMPFLHAEGLIGCVSKEQVITVVGEAQRNGVTIRNEVIEGRLK